MLKIVIGTNEGKVLCISNNEDEIKASMVNYLIDTDQEPTEDFFESRNWGEYDIDVYEYHQPQLNENQQKWINRLTINYAWYGGTAQHALHATLQEPEMPDLPQNEFAQVLEVFSKWVQEQEAE